MMLRTQVQQGGLSAADALGLTEAVLTLGRTQNLADLARTACARLRTLLGCDGVSFVLREGDQVHYAEEDAIGGLWKGRRFPASACISGWAVEHARPAVIEDIYADPRIPAEAYRPTFVKSLLMTPAGTPEPLAALGAYWATPHTGSAREQLLAACVAEAVHSGLLRCRSADNAAERSEREDRAQVASQQRLLAAVAHDLSNPLSAILNTSAALHGVAHDATRTAELAARIRHSAERASFLVEQLQAVSQLAASRPALNLGTTRLDHLCRAVVDEVRRAHPHRQLRIAAAPVSGLWDGERLRGAMLNLVNNAVVHGDPAASVEVRACARGDEAAFAVRSQGTPIPAARLAHLFEPLRQGPGARDSLGLYLAQQIAAAHGGRIEVHSSAEEGTTFTLRVPLQASTLESAAPAPRQVSG